MMVKYEKPFHLIVVPFLHQTLLQAKASHKLARAEPQLGLARAGKKIPGSSRYEPSHEKFQLELK
jgi:hypothetical protein